MCQKVDGAIKHIIEGCPAQREKYVKSLFAHILQTSTFQQLCELIAGKVETTDGMTVHPNQLNTSVYARDFALFNRLGL
jgi:hypothetical protein